MANPHCRHAVDKGGRPIHRQVRDCTRALPSRLIAPHFPATLRQASGSDDWGWTPIFRACSSLRSAPASAVLISGGSTSFGRTDSADGIGGSAGSRPLEAEKKRWRTEAIMPRQSAGPHRADSNTSTTTTRLSSNTANLRREHDQNENCRRRALHPISAIRRAWSRRSGSSCVAAVAAG